MMRTVVGAVAALTVAGVGAATWHETASSCIVGVIGAEASVTVTGWRASAECADAVHKYPRMYYLRATPPTEAVICEVSKDHRRYVVRDAGLLLIAGRGLCAGLTEPDQPKSKR